jgi:excisionase family DNA binding protein
VTAPERFVTTEDVAVFLKKPKSWIYNNAETQGMPFHRIGRQWRWRLSEVAAWVERKDPERRLDGGRAGGAGQMGTRGGRAGEPMAAVPQPRRKR